METAPSPKDKPILYFNNFHLLNAADISILCKYKQFIEKIIMRLGQDWRIQSNLLGQDIVGIRNAANPQNDFTNFNLFNQFLCYFLKGKIGKQYEYTTYTLSTIQKAFNQSLTSKFPEKSIHTSITFQSLALGFSFTVTDVWNKIFNTVISQQKQQHIIKPFGKMEKWNIEYSQKNMGQNLFQFNSIRGSSSICRKIQKIQIFSFSEMDMHSQKNESKYKNTIKWSQISSGDLSEYQLKQIQVTIKMIRHNIKKTQILSHFVCYVDQLFLQSGQKVRIFSLSNEFYITAFIVWLIFNVKAFFQLKFDEYCRYVSQLMLDNWKPEYERPLKKFEIVLERERNKLLNDYDVDLQDDEKVLLNLVDRIRNQIKKEWDEKLCSVKQFFLHKD